MADRQMAASLCAASTFSTPHPQHEWNAMIKRKLLAGDFHGCFTSYFSHTQSPPSSPSLAADNFSFPILLKAAAGLSSPTLGSLLHAQALKSGFFCHPFVQTAIINMYSCFSRPEDARKVFDQMPQRDIVAWNSVLSAFAASGRMDSCIEIFRLMPAKDRFSFNILISGFAAVGDVESAMRIFDGCPCRDDFSWNSVISGYVKAGDMESALSLFDEMPQRNLVSWNTVISGFLQIEQYEMALNMLSEMKSSSSLEPNESTLAAAIAASAHLGSLRSGTELHLQALELNLASSPRVAAALIDMYAKSGSLERALMAFYKAETKDVFVWNSVIAGLAAHGRGEACVKLFADMVQRGVKPDDISFIGLFHACSHAGMVSEGCRLFAAMDERYGVSPKLEHYGCVIDLLSRAGEVGRAYGVMKGMPFPPGKKMIGAIANGCLIHGDLGVGVEVGKMMAERKGEMGDGEYLMLAKLCEADGRHEEGRRWRRQMRADGVRKEAGFSEIEVGGKVHRFLA